jgi:hypothetical protein
MTAAINPYYGGLANHVVNNPTLFGYRMGASFTPDPANDFWWNVVDANGTITVCGEPPGWEGVTWVTPMDTAGGVDGGFAGPASIAPKQLDCNAVIIGGSPQLLRQKLAALRSLLGPRKQFIWEQYDWATGERWGLVCLPTGSFAPTPPSGSQWGGEVCSLAFSVVAASPFKLLSGGPPESLSLQLPVDTVSGRTYAKTYNFNYGATTSPGGQGIAVNQGDSDSWPVFIITGPVQVPQISNDTTSETFYLNANIASGVTVTIDGQTGVVNPANYRLIGDPWNLVPGQNNVRWRETAGSFDPAATLTIQWRSTKE